MKLLRNPNMQSMPRHQKGALLIVALVMVLLMTIVGMTAIRGTGLQESMAGNMRERNITFQAAESGLRSGEAVVALTNKTLPAPDCTAGFCSEFTPAESVGSWAVAKWSDKAAESKFKADDVASKPRYVVEEVFMAPGALAAEEGSGIDVASTQVTGVPQPYRISARATGITGQSDVVVQSIYKRRQ